MLFVMIVAMFGLFAVAFGFGFVRALLRDRALAARGVLTDGVIARYQTDDDGTYAIVRYQTRDGRFYESTATTEYTFAVGATVRVRYVEDTPEDGRIDVPAEYGGRTIGF
jgi:hypothetical protein